MSPHLHKSWANIVLNAVDLDCYILGKSLGSSSVPSVY